jgi:hypothetical protein
VYPQIVGAPQDVRGGRLDDEAKEDNRGHRLKARVRTSAIVRRLLVASTAEKPDRRRPARV